MSAAHSPTSSFSTKQPWQIVDRKGPVHARPRGSRFPERYPARHGRSRAIATIVHGTTVGTNALLERKGGKAGVIATEGFRDVLEMRRRDRPQTWGLWGQFEPVVPRERRLEVRERVLADGTVRTAIDPEEVNARARELLALGVEAVAVTFINSYANGENERAAAEAIRIRLAERLCEHLERHTSRNPRIRTRIHDGAERLSAACGRRLSRPARVRSRGTGHLRGNC